MSRVDQAPIYTNMDRWVTISASRFRELEKLEAQLQAVRPYLQHRSDCHANTGFIGAECGCGLEAAIGEGES